MLSVSEIAQNLSGRVEGDSALVIDTIRSIISDISGGLAIVFSHADLKNLADTSADVLVGPIDILQKTAKAHIVIEYLDVTKINQLLRYYKVHKYQLFDQENTSTIDGVYIGRYCQIGEGCYFMPGVRIMNGVTIGNNVVINVNTVIKEGTVIGNNVTIDSNNSIGNYSFEYMSEKNGNYQRVESIGRVIIEDDVEIGCNNTIDRGTLGDTIIGQGSKIDNQVQIGHDCKIGKHCLIISQCGFAGHTTLGDYVVVNGQVGTAGHINIGSHSIIKAKSGVSHSCPPGSNLFGYPAKESKLYYQNLAVLNKISEHYQKLKRSRSEKERWFNRLLKK